MDEQARGIAEKIIDECSGQLSFYTEVSGWIKEDLRVSSDRDLLLGLLIGSLIASASDILVFVKKKNIPQADLLELLQIVRRRFPELQEMVTYELNK